MDDDLVLRTLGEDLARDDPELAALLTGTAPAWAPLTGPPETPLHEAPSDDVLSPDEPAPETPAAATLAHPVRRHSTLWLLLAVLVVAVPVLTAALLLPARVTLGVSAMLLILGSPLAVCWLCAATDRTDPEATPDP